MTIRFPAASYQPDQTYRIQVTVADPSMVRWGFQLTARSATDGAAMAGTLSSVDDMTRCVSNAGLQWIEHTLTGTRLGTTAGAMFEFDWHAPSAVAGDVLFYAAAVAGDGQDTGVGDLVYSARLTVPLTEGASVPKPQFTSDGVTDSWGGQPGVAPGAWVTIQGSGLASGKANWSPVSGQLLPTRLGGVQVMINNEAAAISAVNETSVTFLVPADMSGGSANIVLIRNGIPSDTVTVPVTPALPAIFAAPNPAYPVQSLATVATAGAGLPMSLLNPIGSMIGSNTVDARVSRPALLGESIDFYVTGLGATTPEFPTSRLPMDAPAVAGNVTVHFANVARKPDLAVLIAPGLYLVRTTIPDSLPLYFGTIGFRVDVDGIFSPGNVVLNLLDPSLISP